MDGMLGEDDVVSLGLLSSFAFMSFSFSFSFSLSFPDGSDFASTALRASRTW